MRKLNKYEEEDLWDRMDTEEGVCFAGKKCILILFSASEKDLEIWEKRGYKKVSVKKARELLPSYKELKGCVKL